MLDQARSDSLEHIDGYLSNRAADVWPGALVLKRETATGEGWLWLLRRPGKDDVGLGDRFKAARMALDALKKAEKAQEPKQ